mmetsp:Transcript_19905/g.60105  ORF Transcript_19905/g.60105 Transcript_19905/m.60105 type:complete len:238 (+) Transcript_19905:429-1142(+)
MFQSNGMFQSTSFDIGFGRCQARCSNGRPVFGGHNVDALCNLLATDVLDRHLDGQSELVILEHHRPVGGNDGVRNLSSIFGDLTIGVEVCGRHIPPHVAHQGCDGCPHQHTGTLPHHLADVLDVAAGAIRQRVGLQPEFLLDLERGDVQVVALVAVNGRHVTRVEGPRGTLQRLRHAAGEQAALLSQLQHDAARHLPQIHPRHQFLKAHFPRVATVRIEREVLFQARKTVRIKITPL